MINEYRYAIPSQLPAYRQENWQLAGYAGHHVNYVPALFVKRPVRGVAIKNERRAHKTTIRKLNINDGLAWRG